MHAILRRNGLEPSTAKFIGILVLLFGTNLASLFLGAVRACCFDCQFTESGLSVVASGLVFTLR